MGKPIIEGALKEPNIINGDHTLLLKALQQGRRLPCPPGCPPVIYRDLMKTFDISNLDDLPHKIYNFKSTTLGCKEKGIRNQMSRGNGNRPPPPRPPYRQTNTRGWGRPNNPSS